MAITRAQQFRQMLEDGGMLVKPGNGKRPGYRSAKAQEVQGRTKPSGFSAPSKPGGRQNPRGTTLTRDDDVAPGYNPKTRRFERPDGTPEKARTPQEVKQDLRRAINQGAFRKKGIFDTVFPTATNFLDTISRSKLARINNAIQRQNYIDSLDLNDPKEKEEYDRIMNELGGLGIDIIAGPETLTDTRLKQPMSLGAPKTTFKPSMSFDDDVSSLGDPDVKDILGKGFQDYLKRFDPPDRDDRGPSDPCLGPNPPSYCFIGKKADQTVQNAIARNLGGLSPRIGGSIFDFTGMADGGIVDMAREEMFLGGIVKGIKKGLKGATRAIKKVAKSPIGKAALLGAGLGFAGIGPFKGLAGTKLGTSLSSLFQGKTSSILNFVKDNPMLAISGASLIAGAMTPKEEDEFDLEAYYAANRLNPNPDLFPRILGTQFAADGGRIGYADAGGVISEKEMKKLAKSPLYKGFKKMYGIDPSMAKENPAYDEKFDTFEKLYKEGFQKGGNVEPVAKKTMPLLDMGGQEMDLRDNGGFVPIGRMEKADDVPARLSKNEFVFTAEAVRNAGDGDVDKGAEVMYNMMKNLEDGGNVSEESQGLEGARRMFQTSKRLEEVL
jgi:hypothetical protein